MKKIFFVDFDGTITKKDTCVEMVKAFAKDGWQEIDKLWQEKALSTEECANKTFELFTADMNDVKKLLDGIEIDECFIPFLEFCNKTDSKVYILSDGYNFNIKSILDRYNIHVPYYANELTYDGRFKIKCIYQSEKCKDCGCCKKEKMAELKEKDAEIIYIGDGYSDLCPSAEAHFVYAKGVLYDYCLKKGIGAENYSTFKDILFSLGEK